MSTEAAQHLIIGQGLAGSALAWHLIHAGQNCLVVDRPLGESASRVAAGLVNPLLGRKIKPDWRQAECLEAAHSYYRATEAELGGSWWDCCEIWRELADEDQLAFWQQRREDPLCAQFAGPLLPWLPDWEGKGQAAITYGAAVLHAEQLVNAQRNWLKSKQSLCEAQILPSDIETLASGKLRWREQEFESVIWCNGFEIAQQLKLPWLESRLSQGCILDLKMPENFLAPEAVLHFGHWLVRHGEIWRLGASYDWVWSSPGEPSPTAPQELLHSLNQRYQGEYQCLRARAAVRPIIRYSQPVAGALPGMPGQYMLGGLGSRGCTTAPWVSQQLTKLLMQGEELPADLEPIALLRAYEKRQSKLAAR